MHLPPTRWGTPWEHAHSATPLSLGVAAAALLAMLASPCAAQGPKWRSAYDPRGIPGTLILAGDDVELSTLVQAYQQTARRQPVVVVGVAGPLASASVIAAVREGLDGRESVWGQSPDAPGFVEQLTHIRPEAAVWIDWPAALDPGEFAASPTAAWVRTELARGRAFLVRERVARAWLSTPQTGDATPVAGDAALPGCQLLAAWSGSEDAPPSSAAVPEGRVGIAVHRQGILLLRGRTIAALRGEAAGQDDAAEETPLPAAKLCLAAGAGRPAVHLDVDLQHPADLTILRRAAELRQVTPPFAVPRPAFPRVANGTLLIVGGGGFTPEMVRLFVDAAGGATSRIVVIPGAEESPQLENRSDVRRFREAGAGRVNVLPVADASLVPTARDLAVLREATGVWFGGGRQWRLVDRYEGTPLVPLCHAVLRRGGIIGGSSAGATIQGEYLVRGHPLGNTVMMAEGYERGFAFLPGTAIDQHFTQRQREADLIAVKRAHPQLVCLGIDESTALVVRGTEGRVIGLGTVSVYDRRPGEAPEELAARTLLRVGDRYDFRTRSVLSEPSMR